MKLRKKIAVFLLPAVILAGCLAYAGGNLESDDSAQTSFVDEDGDAQISSSDGESGEDEKNGDSGDGEDETGGGDDESEVSTEQTASKSGDVCTLYILDVGQGSCALVELDGSYMIIDGGNSDKSSFVVSYLKKKDIDEFEYVIATHYDSDHISGLIGVMNVFDVKTLFAPDYTTDSKTYSSFMSMAKKQGFEIEMPDVGETYSFGEAYFTVICPNGDEYSEENDYSIGIKFCYGDNSFIIAGDATSDSEAEMVRSGIDLAADIYVVNHHGSKYSSSASFVNAISPDYAVISVGEDNSYGHPSETVILRLEKSGASVLRTDESGTITFTLDGEEITCSTENESDEKNAYGSSDDSDGSDDADDSDDGLADDVTYIINANSKKIHKTTCRAVSKMSGSNKIYYTGTLQEALDEGYEKCGICLK